MNLRDPRLLSLLVFFNLISALHELLSDNLSTGLADHTPNTCIVCTPEAFSEDEVSVVAIYIGLQDLETKYVHAIYKKKRPQMYNVMRIMKGSLEVLWVILIIPKDKIGMYNSAIKLKYM